MPIIKDAVRSEETHGAAKQATLATNAEQPETEAKPKARPGSGPSRHVGGMKPQAEPEAPAEQPAATEEPQQEQQPAPAAKRPAPAAKRPAPPAKTEPPAETRVATTGESQQIQRARAHRLRHLFGFGESDRLETLTRKPLKPFAQHSEECRPNGRREF